MVLKEDQERIKTLLKDTITLLCRNGLTFKTEFSIEALIGITLDKDDILLVNINEIIRTELGNKLAAAAEQSDQESVGDDWEDGSGDDVSPRGTPHSPSQKKRRKRHRSSGSQRNDGGGGGGHGDMSNTSFPDDSSTHSEPPVKRKSTLPNSRNSMKNENDDDSKDIVFIKEEVDTGDWSHTSQGPGHFPADLSGIPSQHQQEHFDNFLQGGSLVPVGAQQSSANLWSDMTGGPGSSMNQTMSPPGSKRSSTVTSNAAATPGDDSQQDIAFETGLLMEAEDGESSNDVSGPITDVKPEKTKLKQSGQAPKKAHKHAVKFQLNERSINEESGSKPLVLESGCESPVAVPESLKYECPECDKVFSRLDNMKRHMKSHTKSYSHQCKICRKYFRDKYDKDNHLETVHLKKKYQCSKCTKCFNTRSSRTYHLRTHTGEFRYLCPKCGKGYYHRQQLNAHIDSFHNHTKPYSCTKCNKTFSRKPSLIQHQECCLENKIVSCPICDKQFKHDVTLKRHMTSHSDDADKFSCEKCGKRYSFRNSWKAHFLKCKD